MPDQRGSEEPLVKERVDVMKKILIVEDDKKIALALSIRVKAEGYEVLVAYDAVTGSSLAIKQKPDLMLLDVSMPAGDAFIVAERVQGNSTTAAMPFIIITAKGDETLRKKALDMGAVAFFEKPYDAGELMVAIQGVLGEPTGNPASPLTQV